MGTISWLAMLVSTIMRVKNPTKGQKSALSRFQARPKENRIAGRKSLRKTASRTGASGAWATGVKTAGSEDAGGGGGG